MEIVVEDLAQEIKDKWNSLAKTHKNISVEKRIQKIVNIPIKDIRNLIKT